jgi:molybdate transport system regulatory protein
MDRKRTASARLRIDLSADVSVGPGTIALLEGIDRSGSLSSAARELRISYRRAWQLVHAVNEAFREPVVNFSTGGKEGGGAELTALGRQLVERYRGLELATNVLTREAFRELAAQASAGVPPAASSAGAGRGSGSSARRSVRRRKS